MRLEESISLCRICQPQRMTRGINDLMPHITLLQIQIFALTFLYINIAVII